MNQSVASNFVGKKIEDYVLTNVLGVGAFGQVFQAQNLITKMTVAIKSVPKTKLYYDNYYYINKQGTQWFGWGTTLNRVKMFKYLESSNNCYLVMEYCNQGDFEQLWKKKNRFISEKDAVPYMKQILNGMKALHELNVIHRDLKLANILIHNGILKLADLGFARRLTDINELTGTALGTLGTMAPEVIEFKPYGILADMFSLGAIFYQMLFGVLPFSIQSYDAFIKDVKNTKPNFNKNGITISQNTLDLLSKMLQYDPKNRMKWNAIYDHPTFQEQERGLAQLNQMTISSIAARQVNMQQNNNVYKNQQQQMDQVTDKNMLQVVRKGDQLQNVQIQEEDKQYDFQNALQQQKQINESETDVARTLELYLTERNQLVFLARLIDEIHKLQHSEHTNVYLPALMLIKKLLLETTKLTTAIKNHQNIFNCKTFGTLYKNQLFVNFCQMLDEEEAVIVDHFNIILSQCRDIFNKMQSPNVEVMAELSPYASQYFAKNYKDTLFNYYLQLQEEKEQQKNQPLKDKQTNLMIFVLDSIAFDGTYKKEMKQNNFNIDQYYEQFNYMTDDEKDKIIEQKFLGVF